MKAKLKPISEKQFMRQVIQVGHLFGWKVAHFLPAMNRRGQWRTAVMADGAGFPDLVLVRGKTAIVAELKVGRNGLTEAQQDWIAALHAAGVRAYCWRPEMWPEIERILEHA